MRDFLIVVVGLLALAAVWAGWTATKGAIMPPIVACTEEAKLCPDGSYVGREAPSCEFAQCPVVQGGEGTIQGSVLLGPTCPVERDPPDPGCADKPYGAPLMLMDSAETRVIKEFSSSADGTFTLRVPPGMYVIRSSTLNVFPRCGSSVISVAADTVIDVAVSCDTGIR